MVGGDLALVEDSAAVSAGLAGDQAAAAALAVDGSVLCL